MVVGPFSPKICALIIFQQRTINNTRLLCASVKSHNYCSSSQQSESTATEITRILKYNNWRFLLESSHIAHNLNPDVVHSVLRRTLFDIDARRLLDFFNWSTHHLGTSQNLHSFSILALVLCCSNLYAPGINVLCKMIDSRVSVSDVLDSILNLYNGNSRLRSRPVVFELLIDVYRKKGMWNEAVAVFLGGHFEISLLCCNSLLKDLSRCSRMDLFWKVYDEMLERKIDIDVYTYVSVITAHCKVGNVREAKGVLLEMEEKGCNPNLIAYNIVIKGLCGNGAFDEALQLKTTMAEKGLVPDKYTYTILIDGFCQRKRSSEGKLILEEMRERGLNPDHFAYTALINGFMKEGSIDEAFRIKNTMVSHGIKLKNC